MLSLLDIAAVAAFFVAGLFNVAQMLPSKNVNGGRNWQTHLHAMSIKSLILWTMLLAVSVIVGSPAALVPAIAIVSCIGILGVSYFQNLIADDPDISDDSERSK